MKAQFFPLEGLTPLDYGGVLSSNLLAIKCLDVVTDEIDYRDDSDVGDSDTNDSDEESENDTEI